MNENYNRQFLQIDFASIEEPEFFRFLQKAEFGAYLILRRYVWRSAKPHQLGLHGYYWDKQLLVAAVENDVIARKMGLRDVTRVSKYHKSLEDFGVIQRLRTGRANIFILGEWIDISEGKDKSKRMEWFYFDRKFGGQHPHPEGGDGDNGSSEAGREEAYNSDLAHSAKSDLQKTPNQNPATWLKTPNQTWLNEPNHPLIDKQIDNKTVNGSQKNPIKALPPINQPEEKTAYIAEQILSRLGVKDTHSKHFHFLVASRIPENIINAHISEVIADKANDPAKLFTYRMKKYAEEKLNQMQADDLETARQKLAASFHA